MERNTLLLIMAVAALVLGAFVLLQNNQATTSVTTDEGTRIEAPGTKVERNGDETRIQAPGVDITVPRKNDGD
jgi:hypothetical protein